MPVAKLVVGYPFSKAKNGLEYGLEYEYKNGRLKRRRIHDAMSVNGILIYSDIVTTVDDIFKMQPVSKILRL